MTIDTGKYYPAIASTGEGGQKQLTPFEVPKLQQHAENINLKLWVWDKIRLDREGRREAKQKLRSIISEMLDAQHQDILHKIRLDGSLAKKKRYAEHLQIDMKTNEYMLESAKRTSDQIFEKLEQWLEEIEEDEVRWLKKLEEKMGRLGLPEDKYEKYRHEREAWILMRRQMLNAQIKMLLDAHMDAYEKTVRYDNRTGSEVE